MPPVAEPVFLYDASARGAPGNVASRELEGTPWHAEFLSWARGNGIDPDITVRVEVREAESGLVAEVTVCVTDDEGRTLLTEDGQDFQRRTERVSVSSLPPALPKG